MVFSTACASREGSYILSCMPAPAALGFRLHTGWAVLVAVAGKPGNLEVLLRQRIELALPGNSASRFVYHEAAKLAMPQAAKSIAQAEAASLEMTRNAIEIALAYLRDLGHPAESAGISAGSKPVPNDLSKVLGSHPLLHTAEAALYRQVVTSACERRGLTVISVRERKVWMEAATAWGAKEPQLRKQIDGLRKSVGAPWATDQKTAMAFALLALRQNR